MPEAIMEETVTLGISDGIATLVLNRPDRLNALTRNMLVRLRAALEECAARDDVRTVLFTGAGRGFCAGQDLSERDPRKLDGPLDLEAIQKELYHPVVALMAEMDKPVIVAVNGIAAGAGSGLALAGDIVIAARSARFIQSFVKVGLSVDAGGGLRLVQALGPARARALLMTGGAIGAEDAAAAGLIWQCIDDDALEATARDIALSLAQSPRTALAAIKKAVAAAACADSLEGYLKTEAALQREAGFSADYREGVLAFLEKRKPRFQA